MCTDRKQISASNCALNLKFTPWSDDHPSSHFFFFLHVLIEILQEPHLLHYVSDSQTNQHVTWQIKWGFTAGHSSTEKLSLSLSLPFLLHCLAAHFTFSWCSPSYLLVRPAHCLLCILQAEDRPLPTCWSERLRRCHAWLCIFLLASLGCWWRAAQPTPPIQRPRSRIETHSRKMCCRLMLDSFVSCTNCYV